MRHLNQVTSSLAIVFARLLIQYGAKEGRNIGRQGVACAPASETRIKR